MDFEDAYLHVPIHPLSQTYLVCSQWTLLQVLGTSVWDVDCLMVVCQDNGASHHSHLVHLHGYLDDFLAAKQDTPIQDQVFLTQLMTHLDFLIHPTKSESTPTQDIIYIGTHSLLTTGCLCPPDN